MSLDIKKRILHTYYGSLRRYNRPVMSQSDVGRKLAIKIGTVNRIIRRFETNGYDFARLVKKK